MSPGASVSDMATVTCETCKSLIAEADTQEDADEIAKYERHASDNDGEVWECALCLDERYREGMGEAAIHDRELRLRRISDHWEQQREQILENADLAYDRMKDGA